MSKLHRVHLQVCEELKKRDPSFPVHVQGDHACDDDEGSRKAN